MTFSNAAYPDTSVHADAANARTVKTYTGPIQGGELAKIAHKLHRRGDSAVDATLDLWFAARPEMKDDIVAFVSSSPRSVNSHTSTWAWWVRVLARRHDFPIGGRLDQSLMTQVGQSVRTTTPEQRDWCVSMVFLRDQSAERLRRVIETLGAVDFDPLTWRGHSDGPPSSNSWAQCWHHPARTPDIFALLQGVIASPVGVASLQDLLLDSPRWDDPKEVQALFNLFQKRPFSAIFWPAEAGVPSEIAVNKSLESTTAAYRAAVIETAQRLLGAAVREPGPEIFGPKRLHAFVQSCLKTPGIVDEEVASILMGSIDPEIRTWALLKVTPLAEPTLHRPASVGPVRTRRR